MKKILTTFFILVTCQVVWSQNDTSGTGLWSQYLYNARLKDELKLVGDFKFRTYGITSDFQQFIARVAIAYKPRIEVVELRVGYGFFKVNR